MKKIILIFLLSIPLSAQVTISGGALKSNQPFHVVATQDGTNVDGFNLYMDNSLNQTGLKNVVWTSGTVTFFMPVGVTKGKHSFQISAFGPGGETRSATLNINVKK